MKNLYTLLAFIMLTGLTSFGQGKVDYDSRSKYYLGFNFGGTYHSKTEVDVNKLYRGGAGFTFGRSFGMKPDNLLSLDLQLRYFLGAYRGLSESQFNLDSSSASGLGFSDAHIQGISDYQNAYGYYVPNFHTWVNDWSLELKLNTNRWRQNTGWNFFVLGGIGTTRYRTQVDFYQPNANDQVKLENDLSNKDILLSDYETNVFDASKRDWMPHFGMGLERQITPNAAFQLMGRMSWTRSNDFDGLSKNSAGQFSGVNDRYHYASAGIKVYLRGRKNAYVDNDRDPINRPNPNPPVQGRVPAAKFTIPQNTPTNVSVNTYTVLALVQNVAGKQNITLTQNGQVISNYNYNANTDKLNFTAQLTQGTNVFNVSAVNNFGNAQDETIIIYNPIVNNVNPPIVTITNPNTGTVTVQNNTFNFVSTVLNVAGKQDISVFINGVSYANYNYNTANKQLTTALNLIPGKNTVSVTGSNSAGTDSKTVDIFYREPVNSGPPPIVTIVSPNVSPFVSNTNLVNVVATIANVSSKNNVSVLVNGINASNFNYNVNSGQVNFTTNLNQGNNTVTIQGVNQFGQDAASTTVVYKPIQAAQPPVVSINTPTNMSVYSTPTASVQATAQFVNSKNDISVLVNGQSLSNFNFNSGSKLVSFSANLISGNNSIQVIGVNTDGQDQAQINVVYNRPVVKTPPVVNIFDPAVNNKTYTVSSITAKATVLNVSNKNNITVQVNGGNTNNFSFNSSSNIVTVPMTLNNGTNTLLVSATNNDGSDSDQKTVRYKKVVTLNPPTVNFTNPTVSPVTVSAATYALSAVTTNISSQSQIVLKQNGAVINTSAYSFVGSTINYTSALVVGNNTFDVTVSNNAGTDSKITLIVYKKEVIPCTKPTIGYVAPAPNSTVTSAAQVIEAQINNHIPGTTVTLKLNGAALGAMAFNAASQIAKKPVTLIQGVNTLEVTVTNSCGTNKSTFIITYSGSTPCVSPIVKINSSGAGVVSSNYVLSSSVTAVNSSSQVVVMINGSSVPFSIVNGVVTANLNLSAGSNVIVVTATNACGNDSKTVTVNYTPCAAPSIKINSNITSATVSAFLFKASVLNVTNNNQVTVKLNGIQVPFSMVVGKVAANLTLQSGVNSIVITAATSCGNDSKTFKVNYTPCKVPTIKLNSSLASVTKSAYVLQASAVNVSASSQIVVRLNGKVVPFSYAGGKISANVTLQSGKNNMVITATTTCGNDSKSLNINYTPCTAPKLSFVKPTGSNATTSSSSYQLIVKTNGAGLQQQNLAVKLNGNTISSAYNSSLNTLTINATNLKNGVNTIQVNASNSCGSDVINFKITSNTCISPKIVIPTGGSTNLTSVKSLSYSFTATVSGMASNSGIKLLVNGVSTAFTFSSTTNRLSAKLRLKEGSNSIVLSAVNACGNDTKSFSVKANTCVTPNLTSISPRLTTTIDGSSQSFILSATGVTSVNEITVKLNGTTINKSFSRGRVSISTSNLKVGLNTLIVSVANRCGNDKVTYRVTRRPCVKPVVQQLSNSTNVTKLAFSYSAIVTGATAKSSISLKVNNSAVAFSYNTSTGKVTANLTLKEGVNTIVLLANNKCGNASKTHRITAKTCKTPDIKVGYPTNTSITTANTTFSLIAIGINVVQSNIKVTNNGANIPFSFNSSTGKITVNVANMKPGANNIKIKGSNACGSSEVNYVITYTGSTRSKTITAPPTEKAPQKRN